MFGRINKRRATAYLCATWFAATAGGQSVWHVDDDAAGDPGPGDPSVSDPWEDGTAEHPFDSIQEGLDAAAGGDEVLIADGTYCEDGNRDLNFLGKDLVVRSAHGAEHCIIDCGADTPEGGQHRGFLFDHGETSAAKVEGITIINGFMESGGGIFCEAGTPTIEDCRFMYNSASRGGGLAGSGMTVIGCEFMYNDGTVGGAVCVTGSGTIRDCMFTENFGLYTGAGSFDGAVSVRGCRFLSNYFMAGVTVSNGAVLSDSVVTGNDLGVYCMSGGIVKGSYVVSNSPEGGVLCSSNSTIEDSVIASNYNEPSGGGIVCLSGATGIRVRNCMIVNNSSDYEGGGGAAGRADCGVVFEGCLFSNNASYCHMADEGGGGLLCEEGADVKLIGCTLAHNTILYGDIGEGIKCEAGELTLENCIVSDNGDGGGAGIAAEGGTINVSYCDIQGGAGGIVLDPAAVLNWGGGNIAADPLFSDPDGADDALHTWEDNDYRLLGHSPCVDAGDNAEVGWSRDLDGRLRFADRIGTPDTGNPGSVGGALVDMGAYEYQCRGDLDGDGRTGTPDLATLLGNYGISEGATYGEGDVDQDGDVDLNDLAYLLAVYGAECE